MKSFNTFQPTQILFGKGRLSEIGEVVARYGKRCLMVTRPTKDALAPAYEIGKESLLENDVHIEHFDGVIPNPTTEVVSAGSEQAKDLLTFQRQGIKSEFLTKLFDTHHDDFWYPTVDELLDAGVIHGIINPSDLLPAKHVFSPQELTELEERAGYLSKGVEVVDLGCGLVEVPFIPQDLDPLKNLGPIEPTPQKKGEVINLVLDNISNTAASAGNPEDEQTGKDNFKINLIKQLPTIISRFVITPKVIGVYQLTAQTLNSKIKNLLSCFDFSIAAREFLKYVAIRILGIILEWLFIKIKKIIVDKIKNLIKFIIKEKITIYVNSIKSTVQSKTNSLTSGLNSKVGDISKSLYK